MTLRSIKALRGTAMLAALVLPALASAQDTSSTGGRVMRDSASGRNMRGMHDVRFDTTQAITVTGVTIVRLDSLGGMRSAGGSQTHGDMSHGGEQKGRMVSAIIRSGTDSMHIVLGPSDYLESKQLRLLAGDVISVKGVRQAADCALCMGTDSAGAMNGRASASGMSSASTASSASGSAGAAIGMTAASVFAARIVATEITKNGMTVTLRDRSTGEPSWETMGSDAGKNRGRVMMPSMMRKDSTQTSSPVRKP